MSGFRRWRIPRPWRPAPRTVRRLAALSFTFFAAKGALWLLLPALLAWGMK